MLEEIKKIKLNEIMKILKEYENYLLKSEENKRVIAELDDERTKENYMVPYKRFNFIQKYITKRDDYKKHIEDLDNRKNRIEELNVKITKLCIECDEITKKSTDMTFKSFELRDNMKKISESTNIEDFDMTFKSAIEFIKENNKEVVLRENDKYIFKNNKEYTGVKDLMLVHKTDFIPKYSRIKSPKELDIKLKSKITLNEKEYEYEYSIERDTVHFAVNNEVSSHAYGNWSDKKYSILIPCSDVPKENIASLYPVDTFTRGGVDIPDSAYILCPNSEKEIVMKNNPNVNVIGYEGSSVKDYSSAVISGLGYRVEQLGAHNWSDSKSSMQFLEIAKNNKYTYEPHDGSESYVEENILRSKDKVVEIFKIIKENNLIKSEEDAKSIYEQLNSDEARPEGSFKNELQEAFGMDFIGIEYLYDGLNDISINIDSNSKKIIDNIKKEEGYIKSLDQVLNKDIDKKSIDPELIESLNIMISNFGTNKYDLVSEIIQRRSLSELIKIQEITDKDKNKSNEKLDECR